MAERMHLRGEPNLQLSPREHQVLEFIRLGMTNRQIAQQLLVSTNTINKHVEHLLSKLDVRNRVQAAVWSREET